MKEVTDSFQVYTLKQQVFSCLSSKFQTRSCVFPARTLKENYFVNNIGDRLLLNLISQVKLQYCYGNFSYRAKIVSRLQDAKDMSAMILIVNQKLMVYL